MVYSRRRQRLYAHHWQLQRRRRVRAQTWRWRDLRVGHDCLPVWILRNNAELPEISLACRQ